MKGSDDISFKINDFLYHHYEFKDKKLILKIKSKEAL